MTITYHLLAFYQAGSPKTGLSPSAYWVYDMGDRSSIALSSGDIEITEFGEGMYRLAIDWSSSTFTGVDGLAIRIDGDPGAAFGLTDSERYAFFEGERNDTVSMENLYDALTGDWEIVSNQLIMKDRDGATLHTFNLFDANGDATSTNPASRERV